MCCSVGLVVQLKSGTFLQTETGILYNYLAPFFYCHLCLEYLISLQQSLLKVVYYISYVHCLLDIFLEDSFFIAFKYVFFLNSIHLWAVGVQWVVLLPARAQRHMQNSFGQKSSCAFEGKKNGNYIRLPSPKVEYTTDYSLTAKAFTVYTSLCVLSFFHSLLLFPRLKQHA